MNLWEQSGSSAPCSSYLETQLRWRQGLSLHLGLEEVCDVLKPGVASVGVGDSGVAPPTAAGHGQVTVVCHLRDALTTPQGQRPGGKHSNTGQKDRRYHL